MNYFKVLKICCVLINLTRLSRLPLLNLLQMEALKGTSHLITLISFEIFFLEYLVASISGNVGRWVIFSCSAGIKELSLANQTKS